MAGHNMAARLGARKRYNHGIFHIMGHGQHAAGRGQSAQNCNNFSLFGLLVRGCAV